MGSEEWLDQIFDFTVERQEILRRAGKSYYPMEQTGIGVLHTTEGPTIEGAFATLHHDFSAPHFIAGENRIIQCRPIGVQAAALHAPANNRAYVQIEMVGFCSTDPWIPEDSTLQPTVAIMAYAARHWGIPLRAPNDWVDDLSDCPRLATNNPRRMLAAEGLWDTEQGWWFHLETPHQAPTWHHDPGALRRTELLAMADAVLCR
ncbi:MAG TPA: N-acetylmuramoyl-L-alanine amidase [Pyrinomonadaceae bacterium]